MPFNWLIRTEDPHPAFPPFPQRARKGWGTATCSLVPYFPGAAFSLDQINNPNYPAEVIDTAR
jgi:hypothetical protein